MEQIQPYESPISCNYSYPPLYDQEGTLVDHVSTENSEYPLHTYIEKKRMFNIFPPYNPMKVMLSREVDNLEISSYMYAQPKINGVRAHIQHNGYNFVYLSREMKDYHNVFDEGMREEIERLMCILPSYCGLDGELISNDLEFGKIVAEVKCRTSGRSKKSPEPISLQYVIFDMISFKDVTLESRLEVLAAARDRYIEIYGEMEYIYLAPTSLISTQDELVRYQYDSLHLEGVVLKHAHLPYRSGKNDNTIKLKNIIHYDDYIVSITEDEVVISNGETFKRPDFITEGCIHQIVTIEISKSQSSILCIRDYE